MADLFTLIGVTRLKRTFPHVGQVTDWAAQTSLRLLWDRVFSLEERLQAAEANVKLAGTTINTLNTQLASVEAIARQAFALAQTPATSPALPGDPASGGDGPCDDDGQAGDGVNNAYGDGHPGVVPQTAFEFGRIIGGVANEYPLLLAPTPDLPTREAFIEELLLRMIWHLNEAGFTAGRQKNPSGAISKDKLTVDIGGEAIAYDVFSGVDPSQAVPVRAGRVCPANYQPDGGIPD